MQDIREIEALISATQEVDEEMDVEGAVLELLSDTMDTLVKIKPLLDEIMTSQNRPTSDQQWDAMGFGIVVEELEEKYKQLMEF